MALAEAGLAIERQVAVPVRFRGKVVGDFKSDLMVGREIILEIKAVHSLLPAHEAQLTNYLKATGIPLGLLLNFGPKPSFKRKILRARLLGAAPPPEGARGGAGARQ